MRIHGGALVDFGNVIIGHWLSDINEENFQSYDYNSIPAVPGAFCGIAELVDRFGGNVTVVYKATDVATDKIQGWYKRRGFLARTGLSERRIVRTSGGRDKTGHLRQYSATHYGTTVVIDDRLEVLSFFVGKVERLFLFRPRAEEIKAFDHTGALSHCTVVASWKEILALL